MADERGGRLVTIVNPQGLHARPARLFVEVASGFEASIEVIKDGQCADGKSILSILTLAAEKGAQLLLRASGPGAQEALHALAELVEQGFRSGETAEGSENQGGVGSQEPASAEAARGGPE